MAVNAVDSGRVRQLHAEAQDVATGLRQLSPGPEAFQPAVERLCELSRAVVKLRKAADDLEQPDAQRMWQQRARWMHEELIALTAERLQEGSPELYWDKLMSMLYHAAAESTVLMQEKEELAARVTQLEEKLAAEAPGRGGDGLSLSADAARGAAAGQEIVNQAAKDTREALELQTKLVVAQQEAQRRAADQRDTAALLQRCQGEQAAAEKLVDALQQEKLQLQHSVQHQLQVIQQLMSKSEETSSLKTDRARQLQELQLHNRTLSVNLEANARVVEKLIGLNNELMDRLNSLPSHTPTRSAGATAAAPARPKLHNPADGNFAGDVVSGNVAQCGNGVSGQVPLELGSQIERNENPTTTTASARPQDTSLTAAFERFLRQDGDDDLAPAGAARLAMVPESPALHAAGSADNSSSTTKTLFSRAADFANFVAGGRSGSEASQVLSMV